MSSAGPIDHLRRLGASIATGKSFEKAAISLFTSIDVTNLQNIRTLANSENKREVAQFLEKLIEQMGDLEFDQGLDFETGQGKAVMDQIKGIKKELETDVLRAQLKATQQAPTFKHHGVHETKSAVATAAYKGLSYMSSTSSVSNMKVLIDGFRGNYDQVMAKLEQMAKTEELTKTQFQQLIDLSGLNVLETLSTGKEIYINITKNKSNFSVEIRHDAMALVQHDINLGQDPPTLYIFKWMGGAESMGKGGGLTFFKKILQESLKHNLKGIELSATGGFGSGTSDVGYLVWPRWGFDNGNSRNIEKFLETLYSQDNLSDLKAQYPKAFAWIEERESGNITLTAMFSVADKDTYIQLSKLWEKFGNQVDHAFFDLTKNSASWAVFERYGNYKSGK